MLVYRIVHSKYSNDLYASGMKGRWNGSGRKVIYTGESIAIALLENMVRRQGVGFNNDFKTMLIEIPDGTAISKIDIATLKDGWRKNNDSQCQYLGDLWYDSGKTMILKVPSAILPQASNYILNSTHPDYGTVKIIAVTDLAPDERIEDILKNYSKK